MQIEQEASYCQIRVKLGFTDDGNITIRLEVLEEPLLASMLRNTPEDEAAIWEMICNAIRDYRGMGHSSQIDTPFIRLQQQVEKMRRELEAMSLAMSFNQQSKGDQQDAN
jgi:hypothetical protein